MARTDSTPDHRLTITSTVTLRFAVTSTTDSSLVVTGPGEVLCDDDGAGALDAAVVDTSRPGEYGIYIGHLGQAGTYRLEISETRCVGGAHVRKRRRTCHRTAASATCVICSSCREMRPATRARHARTRT